MEKTSDKNITYFVYLAACFSAITGLLFGYDTGVISSAILFIKKEYSLTTFMEEFVLSSVLIGAVIGTIIGGKITDIVGRKKMIISMAAVFTIGALCCSLPKMSIQWLVSWRIVVGISIGISSFVTPLYISEVSPVTIRGKLVGFNQLAITIGIVISYLTGYALAGFDWGWRGMFAVAMIPSILLGIGMLFMPYSPRWLISKGLNQQAREVLIKIRGTNDVNQEINEIQAGLKEQSGGFRELLDRSVRPAMIVGIGLAIFQQITGINTVIYYAPTIFELAGFKSAASAILATIGVGVVNVLATIYGISVVDKIGRRKLLFIGLSGMTISLFVLGLGFEFKDQLPNAIGWISSISLMVYVAFFAISLGQIVWLIISEIYPLRIRGQAMSIATFFNWSSNFVMGLTFLTLIHLMGEFGTFSLYAFLSIFSLFFVYYFVPETKNLSLEEIEASWKFRNRVT